MKSFGSQRPTAAFTLLELLVAAGVGVLLTALVLTVANSVFDLWNRANGRLATSIAAAAVLEQVEADLQAAVFRADGQTWLAATVLTNTTNSGIWVTAPSGKPTGPESLRLEETEIERCRFGVAGVWLRLFASPVAELRAVSYQIVRRAQTTAPNAEAGYLLFRSAVTAQNTFTAGYNLHPTTGNYRTVSGTEGLAGNVIRPSLNQVLADHVVDFGVRFYRITPDRLEPYFPATAGGVWSNSELTQLVVLGTGGNSETQVPDVAEIMVRILTEEGVRQVRLFENPPLGYQSSSTWWEIVERYSHVYVRRVSLHTRGP